MEIADVIMLIVCVPLIVMMWVLVYIFIALVLKEGFNKTIWPFNKKEE